MNDMTIRRPLTWQSAELTDVGTVRDINEDAVLSQPQQRVWTVADGMGGHDGGRVASQMITTALSELPKTTGLDDTVCAIEHALHQVNQHLLSYSRAQLQGRIIGSTVVSLIICGHIGICLWAGDSRLYRLRNNILKQLTHDHSHVEELVQRGEITREEALTHPQSNVITRAVGTSNSLYLDIDTFDVRVGDTFLLCSDGLYNAVTETDIEQELLQSNYNDAVEVLVKKALDNNASDNVSLIVVTSAHKPT